MLDWMVEPQAVWTGNPNCGVVQFGGGGAGVVCRVASLVARERPELESEPEALVELVERVGERSRKSVTRKEPGLSDREPWARLAGQRVGTMSWMALREVCSPANMTCASLPRPVLRKKCFDLPLVEVVIFAVVEKPDPP